MNRFNSKLDTAEEIIDKPENKSENTIQNEEWKKNYIYLYENIPGLLWLSGLSTGLWTMGVPGSIPNQGTCLGCPGGPGPQLEAYRGNQLMFLTLMFLSLSFYLPSPLSKNK